MNELFNTANLNVLRNFPHERADISLVKKVSRTETHASHQKGPQGNLR